MLRKPDNCKGCPLYIIGKGFSHPQGTGKNGVLIIGEALGQNEAYHGTPFVKSAEAGSCLEDVFRRLEVDREDFVLYNIVNCQPPGNNLEGADYEEEAAEKCRVYLDYVVEEYKPKAIVAAGNIPLKYLTNFTGVAKEGQSITSVRGYNCEGYRYKNIPVIPTLHPSYVNRTGRKYIGTLMLDIQFALDIAAGKQFKYEHDYNVNPTLRDMQLFYKKCAADRSLIIQYDIETPYTKEGLEEFEYEKGSAEILQIQLNTKPGEAIVIDTKITEMLWYDIRTTKFKLDVANEWYKLIKALMSLPNLKVAHNGWDFDNYILALNGIKVVNSHDTMWLYHHLNPDVRGPGMGLEFITPYFAHELPFWKHLMGKDRTFYCSLDVDSLSRIYPSLKKALQSIPRFDSNSKNLWEGVNDDVIKLWPILNEMTKRGLPMDITGRDEFVKTVKKRLDETKTYLKDNYPEHLRNRRPTDGFVFVPAEYNLAFDRFKAITNWHNDGKFILFRNKEAKGEYRSQYIERNTRRYYEVKTKKQGEIVINKKYYSGLLLRDFVVEKAKYTRLCRLEEFNPRSKDQVIEFIKWVGDIVPKKYFKGKESDTTDKNKIHGLWAKTGDPFYLKVIFLRELEKLLDTYIGDGVTKGWIIGADKRIHSSFKPFPATGQLSTTLEVTEEGREGGNILAIPKYGGAHSTKEYRALATEFRKCIVAKPGHTFLKRDYNSAHALTISVEAKDAGYMRMVRNDIHSYVAAHILSNIVPIELDKLSKKAHHNMVEMQEHFLLEKTEWFLKDLETWSGLPDDKLREKLKWIKFNHEFTRNRRAKPGILGIGFGMTAFKLYEENKESFKSQKEAQLVFDILMKEFPSLFKYQLEVCAEADANSYLVTRYGYIRWFYNIYQRIRLDKYQEPKWGESITSDKWGRYWLKKLKSGGDAKEAIAFRPANHAFGKIKEAMRECEAEGYNDKYNLLLQTHDELLWEVPDEFLTEAIENTKMIMERPAKHIKNVLCPDGLIILTEAEVGRNWGDMVKV